MLEEEIPYLHNKKMRLKLKHSVPCIYLAHLLTRVHLVTTSIDGETILTLHEQCRQIN